MILCYCINQVQAKMQSFMCTNRNQSFKHITFPHLDVWLGNVCFLFVFGGVYPPTTSDQFEVNANSFNRSHVFRVAESGKVIKTFANYDYKLLSSIRKILCNAYVINYRQN